MTQEEILEGKKSIALFMNLKVIGEMIYDQDHGQHISRCHYDKHWDWLMPVVEKIEAIKQPDESQRFYINIIGENCIIRDSSRSLQIISNNTSPSKIEAVFKSVVEFIKWYNDKK